MPSFPTRISKLIFNEISNPLSYSSQSSINTTIKAPPFNLLKVLRRFGSTIDGEGGEMNNQNSPQQPPEPIPNRPLRGGKPFDHHRTRTPQFPGKNSEAGEKVRDDASDANSFLEKFKLGADKFSYNKKENPDQQVSEPPPPQPQPPPEDADKIFEKMKKTGLIPNAVAMLDGLCKDGLIQEAMKLFGLMREKGTIPEVVIYTAVVEGYCKAQKLDNAKRVFMKMKNNRIDPNAFSYSVLIQGLYSCKNFEDAVEFCMKMLEDGHSPNEFTFVGLIDGLCREKGLEEAQNVIGKLMQKGFVLNEKAVKDFLNKKVSVSPLVWEAIFGKKTSQKLF